MRYLDARDVFEPPDGDIGDFWNLFQVARWMGVRPWELAAQPDFWYEYGMTFMEIDAGLRSNAVRRAARSPS